MKEKQKVYLRKTIKLLETKLWNMKVTVITIIIGAVGTRTGGPENKRMRRHYPNFISVYIDQNIKKSPGNLRKLAITIEKPSANAGGKNSQMSKIIIIVRTLGKEKITMMWEYLKWTSSTEMKEIIRKKYLKRTIKLIKIKFCCRNLIRWIKTRTVSFCKILRTISKMDKKKLRQMNQRT